MSQVQNTAASSGSGSAATPGGNALNDIDLDIFLKLMISELQNQDPLNPMENDQLLAQISQIREVGATDKLTSTLDSVLLGQNIASATNLIGADIVALSDSGERMAGNVNQVTIDKGEPKLHMDLTSSAYPSSEEGDVEGGNYVYQVVWEGDSGELFSVEVTANTMSNPQFGGAIELSNLPETNGEKRIYRTDRSGSGELQLVTMLPVGSTTRYVDQLSDAQRSELRLSGKPTRMDFTSSATISLKNVSEIRPPK